MNSALRLVGTMLIVCVLSRYLYAEVPQTLLDIHAEIVKKLIAGDYSKRGADVCLGCHDEDEEFPTNAIFLTIHGHPNVKGSPFQQSDPDHFPHGLQCEACHGPAGDHLKKFLDDGEVHEPMLNFSEASNAQPDLRNQICLACHDDYNRSHWQGSPHESAMLTCGNCHEIHNPIDEVRTREGHNEVCRSCHEDVWADVLKRSSHPMRENQLICLDCHDPHGGKIDTEGLLRQANINELCLVCHQEKRGPFTWEHPPVEEDCGLCHTSHGSNQPALLVNRAPQLCQSCHSSVGHRSLRMDPEKFSNEIGAEFQFLNACLNCHAEIHGSNHPAGNLFRR